MKKLLSLVLVLAFVFCLFGCGGDESFKVGLICLHDESSTFDKNFIDSMYRALE